MRVKAVLHSATKLHKIRNVVCTLSPVLFFIIGGCTDNMRSCDMREHSDWLRVISGYNSVQIFHSVMIFT